jgi:DNA-directed RNA polymerase III subunit RPC8
LPDSDGQDLFYDNQETVRFRIEEEIWTDQSPMGPKEKEDLVGTAGAEKSSPYVIRGSMADAGLGPCLWWDGEEEGEVEG